MMIDFGMAEMRRVFQSHRCEGRARGGVYRRSAERTDGSRVPSSDTWSRLKWLKWTSVRHTLSVLKMKMGLQYFSEFPHHDFPPPSMKLSWPRLIHRGSLTIIMHTPHCSYWRERAISAGWETTTLTVTLSGSPVSSWQTIVQSS